VGWVGLVGGLNFNPKISEDHSGVKELKFYEKP
jgi:hypothetical protein